MDIESPTGHNVQTRLKASLLGVVGSFVLFAAYLAIPPLGIFSGIFAPFPVAYNRLFHGLMPSLIVLLGTSAAITALFGIFAGFLYLGVCGMTGLFLPELILRRVTASRALFWSTIANLVVFYAGFILYSAVSGIDIQGLISIEISNSLKQAVALYEKGGVTGEDLELIKSSMTTAAELLRRTYPFLITAMLIFIGCCNLAIIKKSTAKADSNPPIGEFGDFKNPDLLVWFLIATGIMQIFPASQITTPALNVLLVIILLYFFQGMAVITALIKKHAVSWLLRILLYTMLIIQPYLLALVAGIGIFDLWADFRTSNKQENL